MGLKVPTGTFFCRFVEIKIFFHLNILYILVNKNWVGGCVCGGGGGGVPEFPTGGQEIFIFYLRMAWLVSELGWRGGWGRDFYIKDINPYIGPTLHIRVRKYEKMAHCSREMAPCHPFVYFERVKISLII